VNTNYTESAWPVGQNRLNRLIKVLTAVVFILVVVYLVLR
jgi:hypothetical protein